MSNKKRGMLFSLQGTTYSFTPAQRAMTFSFLLNVMGGVYYTIFYDLHITPLQWFLTQSITTLVQTSILPLPLLCPRPLAGFFFLLCLQYPLVQRWIYHMMSHWSWNLKFPSEGNLGLLLFIVSAHLLSLVFCCKKTRWQQAREISFVLLGFLLLVLWSQTSLLHIHHYLYGIILLYLTQQEAPTMYALFNQMLGLVFLMDGIWVYGPQAICL